MKRFLLAFPAISFSICSATISFNLEDESAGTIQLHVLAGRLSKVMMNEHISGGLHYLGVKRDLLPAGIYLVQFIAAGIAVTDRVVMQLRTRQPKPIPEIGPALSAGTCISWS